MSYATYLLPALTALPILLIVQWWLLRRQHLRQMAQMRERHSMAQKSAATLLQQARQQVAQVQQELQQAKSDAKRGDRVKAVARPAASRETRETLSKILDEAPARRTAPVDGFADTLPSRQFANSSTFGLLHRASTFAAPN